MSVLVFLIGLLLVGGLLFLGAAVLLGRGETQPPAELDRSPVELPAGRPVTGDDLRALRISVTFRGYRMTEVDWLLDQLAQALDERDAAVVALTSHRTGVRTAEDEDVDPDGAGVPVDEEEERPDA
jgi:DivIVA domain-containing protein